MYLVAPSTLATNTGSSVFQPVGCIVFDVYVKGLAFDSISFAVYNKLLLDIFVEEFCRIGSSGGNVYRTQYVLSLFVLAVFILPGLQGKEIRWIVALQQRLPEQLNRGMYRYFLVYSYLLNL